MRVLVCGGRDFTNYDCVNRILSKLHNDTPITTIISGRARGADALGEKWATERAIQIAGYPANWNRDGKAAGPIRNQQMLDEGKPDLVVAFPGGSGTIDMWRRTIKSGFKGIGLDYNALNPASKRLTVLEWDGRRYNDRPDLERLANE